MKWTLQRELKLEGVIVRIERLALARPRYSLTIGTQNGLKFTPHVYPVEADQTRLGWIIAQLVDEACAYIREEQEKDEAREKTRRETRVRANTKR